MSMKSYQFSNILLCDSRCMQWLWIVISKNLVIVALKPELNCLSNDFALKTCINFQIRNHYLLFIPKGNKWKYKRWNPSTRHGIVFKIRIVMFRAIWILNHSKLSKVHCTSFLIQIFFSCYQRIHKSDRLCIQPKLPNLENSSNWVM